MDASVLIRALRRAVFVDHLLTLEKARDLCDILGLPHTALDAEA